METGQAQRFDGRLGPEVQSRWSVCCRDPDVLPRRSQLRRSHWPLRWPKSGGLCTASRSGGGIKEQVAKEKVRVYAPVKISEGVDWKELHAGITRVMQYFCSEYKTENLLNMGLGSLKEIEEKWVPKLYALDPHKLMRSLEDLSILTSAQMIMYASLARKASSQSLEFYRIDYPVVDPPEWNKFITLRHGKRQGEGGRKTPGLCR